MISEQQLSSMIAESIQRLMLNEAFWNRNKNNQQNQQQVSQQLTYPESLMKYIYANLNYWNTLVGYGYTQKLSTKGICYWVINEVNKYFARTQKQRYSQDEQALGTLRQYANQMTNEELQNVVPMLMGSIQQYFDNVGKTEQLTKHERRNNRAANRSAYNSDGSLNTQRVDINGGPNGQNQQDNGSQDNRQDNNSGNQDRRQSRRDPDYERMARHENYVLLMLCQYGSANIHNITYNFSEKLSSEHSKWNIFSPNYFSDKRYKASEQTVWAILETLRRSGKISANGEEYSLAAMDPASEVLRIYGKGVNNSIYNSDIYKQVGIFIYDAYMNHKYPTLNTVMQQFNISLVDAAEVVEALMYNNIIYKMDDESFFRPMATERDVMCYYLGIQDENDNTTSQLKDNIREYIEDKQQVNTDEVSQHFNCSFVDAQNILFDLKNEGLLRSLDNDNFAVVKNEQTNNSSDDDNDARFQQMFDNVREYIEDKQDVTVNEIIRQFGYAHDVAANILNTLDSNGVLRYDNGRYIVVNNEVINNPISNDDSNSTEPNNNDTEPDTGTSANNDDIPTPVDDVDSDDNDLNIQDEPPLKDQVRDYLSDKKTVTFRDIMNQFGVRSSEAKLALSDLEDDGYLQNDGSGSRYYVIDNNDGQTQQQRIQNAIDALRRKFRH